MTTSGQHVVAAAVNGEEAAHSGAVVLANACFSTSMMLVDVCLCWYLDQYKYHELFRVANRHTAHD